MRLAAYAGASALVATGALLRAFHQRPNFYSATVYLSQSNACVLILTNLALVCACSFMYGLQRLFYGPLRPVEAEQLSEKAWYAVLDTLLAMPSLRDDVGGWMLAIFVLLLGGKVWGWIAEGRLDILEQQPPQNPRVFHARLASSLFLSVAFDAFMLQYCLWTVLEDPRPGMMVIFTFEFAILTIFSLFTLSRYVLALCEIRILRNQTKAKIEERKAEIRAERERSQQADSTQANLPSDEDVDENEIDVPGWEEKRRWLFGLELATDFVKLIIYSAFFAISLTFMGLPMHIMRDVYLTFTAFAKRIQDYANYRRATQNMNNRYSDATAEELSNENTCIVCREVMVPWDQSEAAAGNPPRASRMNEGLRAKKLPCGHILHLRCLKAWLERQQACPTCRRPVIAAPLTARGAPAQGAGQAGNNVGGVGVLGGNAPPAAGNGANGAAAPAPRQNRLRMLNLGPIRIGVYNGPAHQVQDALAQRRQQQPQIGGGATGANAVSTQVQLMQVEQRLLQETRTLAIEQSQLATVRTLEAELARLRALHSQVQAGLGSTNRLATQQVTGNTPATMFSQQPFAMPMMTPPPQFPVGGFPAPQAFQPSSQQSSYGAGHASLPQGMTLPEGWTLTPLHRVGAPSQQGPFPPAPFQQPPMANFMPGRMGYPMRMPQNMNTQQGAPTPTRTVATPATQHGAPVPGSVTPHSINATHPAEQNTDTAHASTTPQSVPGLQQPSTAAAEAPARGPSQPETQTPAPAPEPTPTDSTHPETLRNATRNTTDSPSWGFDWADKNNSEIAGSADQAESRVQQVSNVEESGARDKGKGKAVTVEEAQDQEQ